MTKKDIRYLIHLETNSLTQACKQIIIKQSKCMKPDDFSFGRGYSQIHYLDIRSTSQIQYLDIKSTSQIYYLDIKGTSQVHYLGIQSTSQIEFLEEVEGISAGLSVHVIKGRVKKNLVEFSTKKNMVLEHWILPKDHFKTHLFLDGETFLSLDPGPKGVSNL